MMTWRPEKRAANLQKHGVDLALAERFLHEASIAEEDRSEKHAEQRMRAIGPIGNVLYVYVYIWDEATDEDHAISLRRAEPKECRYYAKNI